MIKKFLSDEYGRNEEFWKNHWDSNWKDKYIGPPRIDFRLIKIIEKYLTSRMKILEGGCGDCQYVNFFNSRGYKIIGVDFSKDTLAKVRTFLPNLNIFYGDIFHLDFQDNTFDCYYSGGVIEHFEEGVNTQLSEARRVLKPLGLLFVTVPHINVYRFLLSKIKRSSFKLDQDGRHSILLYNCGSFTEFSVTPKGYHFHEYIFSTREMRGFLESNAFKIIETATFSPIYGLLDSAFFQKLHGSFKQKRYFWQRIFGLIFRVIRWSEKSDSYIALCVLNILTELFGNLKLYVCVNHKQ